MYAINTAVNIATNKRYNFHCGNAYKHLVNI